jgi:hypothetical protein
MCAGYLYLLFTGDYLCLFLIVEQVAIAIFQPWLSHSKAYVHMAFIYLFHTDMLNSVEGQCINN